MDCEIREFVLADTEAIAGLSAEFVEYLTDLGDPAPRGMSADEIRRDGFGSDPAFRGIVAEAERRVIGYLLHHPGYDIDRGGRIWYVIDLFVTASARRNGVGRALMARAHRMCQEAGGRALVWTVYPPNAVAVRFYRQLGATISDDRLMTWPTTAAIAEG